MDLIIKNGTIITDSTEYSADIGISNGKISMIAETINPHKNTKVIDASNKFIIPGVIDAQTHFQETLNEISTADDFFTGTVSAAFGGVTTILDFAHQTPDKLLKEAIENRRSLAVEKVCVDYSLHCVITKWSAITKKEIKELPETQKIISFRMPMSGNFKMEDSSVYDALTEISDVGLLSLLCENESLINFFTNKLMLSNSQSVSSFNSIRPNWIEAEAVERAITLCSASNSNLNLSPISTKEALQIATQGKEKGLNVFIETSLPYLLLFKEKYTQPDGHFYLTIPPLRSKIDAQSLWTAIEEGLIDIVSSNHCSFNKRDVEANKNDISKIPYGLPGVEYLLPVLFSEGVQKGRISFQSLVSVLCTMPAKIFGLYPQKGTIEIGSDADIVIIDPDKKIILSAETHHMNVDFCPYSELELFGYPEITILRGEVIVENGKFLGKKGFGKFVEQVNRIT